MWVSREAGQGNDSLYIDRTEGNVNKDVESWCSGVLTKWGIDGVHVCMDVLKAGLKTGRASANDVRDLALDQPNVIGAWFHGCARECGFRKSDPYHDGPPYRIKSTKKSRHSGDSAVWILADSGRALERQREFTRILLQEQPKREPQGVML